ncbi:uncharacterized protein LOC120539811 isoform X2 [Polypterus senegalus]|uniref:uncharacterized protein LOC120539811 isoform X2 n=1 Tax=Polypterus senegalus TaxID=55291 RepID=UPI001962B3C6|nr:uncharacterized protein LOC120539811 isoform X2 [Polypterus senegalus]
MHNFKSLFLYTMDIIFMISPRQGSTGCQLQKAKMVFTPNVIEKMSNEHTISCLAPQCVYGVRCHFYKEAESEPFRSVSSDSHQCDFTARGDELLGDVELKSEGILHYSCDYESIINSTTSERSDNHNVKVQQSVNAEVKLLTTEIQKTESIMIKCQGDQAVKGFCYFYKNEALFFSEVYITEERACVITLFGYQLLDQRTMKSVTQVNVSCEIKVIGNDDKWTSRRSRKLTLNINENLNRPALSATSHITRNDSTITLTCELPQTFPEAHCHFYRDDDLHPFKSKSSEDNKCELSVNGHELLGGRTAGMENEIQVRCDYTLNMSLEIHSQYSNYTSIIVLETTCSVECTLVAKGIATGSFFIFVISLHLYAHLRYK